MWKLPIVYILCPGSVLCGICVCSYLVYKMWNSSDIWEQP
jgi:hypothetical protein